MDPDATVSTREAITRELARKAMATGKLWVSIPQAAVLLEQNYRTVKQAVEAGKIPSTLAGKQPRIPTAWIRQQIRLGGGHPA